MPKTEVKTEVKTEIKSEVKQELERQLKEKKKEMRMLTRYSCYSPTCRAEGREQCFSPACRRAVSTSGWWWAASRSRSRSSENGIFRRVFVASDELNSWIAGGFVFQKGVV